ncbi:MAG: hypothetical protein ACLTGI_07935 [Hoylesella buccalis]
MAGYKSGAEAYVSKPFDPQVLDLQVKNIIQLVKTRQTEIQNTKTEDIETSSLNDIDKKFILQINQLIDKNISNNEFSCDRHHASNGYQSKSAAYQDEKPSEHVYR